MRFFICLSILLFFKYLNIEIGLFPAIFLVFWIFIAFIQDVKELRRKR